MKIKNNVWKYDTICRYLGLPLVSNAVFSKVCLQDNRVFLIYLAIYLLFISDDALMFTLTPGNDYFVSIPVANVRSDTTNTQTNVLLPIYS